MPRRRGELDDPELPLLRTSYFEVLIGGREMGFSVVGRLSSETDLEPAPTAGTHRYLTVVLRRALTSSTELYDWRRAVLAGKDDRRDVTIRQLSAPEGRVVNTWMLEAAWPTRWSGPAFDAMASGIAYEELELSFDDLIWVASDTPDKGD